MGLQGVFSAARLAATASFAVALSLALTPPAAAASATQSNDITPDGRTQTQVTVSGAVTSITTKTISGANAVNSFSTFSVGQGNTVNLIVPDTATTLLNLVRNAPVSVNGVLNSYKDGKIGGNVYFADPFGLVVGKGGVINTGSLSVSTPTSAFLDSIIGPDGAISDTAVANLIRGNIPVSENGLVSIQGSINAQTAVRILAQQVQIAGSIDASHAAEAQQLLFSSSVNAQGLQKGTAIVSKGGVIEIVAAGDASVDGALTANNSPNSQAGAVQVLAQGNLSVGPNATLSASARTANNSGGNVRVYAGGDASVASGAQFLARAAGTGNGGAIEASAGGNETIGGGVYDASSPAGKSGSVLFDPATLEYGSGGSASVYTNGTDFSASADDSITVDAGYEINTRNVVASGTPTATQADTGSSLGNSGSITLTAPTITINGSLRADADSGHNPGNITLTASQTDQIQGLGIATATTGITIGGTVKGGVISVTANSDAESSFLTGYIGPLTLTATTLFGGATGINAAYAEGDATATISIGSAAQIVSTGNISFAATTTETAADPALAITTNTGAVAVAVGIINGTATVTVPSGAHITVGGDFSVKATNTPTLDVLALSVSSASGGIGATVAYAQADIAATADVDAGAAISTSHNVSILAANTNSLANSATAFADSGGDLGFALAVSDFSTSATAHLGASLGSTPTPAGNVVVEADNVTTVDSTMGSTDIGTGIAGTILKPITQATSVVGSLGTYALGQLTGADSAAKSGGTGSAAQAGAAGSKLSLASAIGIATVDQSATAEIATDNNGTAPDIISNGNVSVHAIDEDEGIRGDGGSSVDSDSNGSGGLTTQNGVSAGLSFDFYTHATHADIGDGAQVTAVNVGVSAETIVPITITWLTWDSFSTVISHINGNLGANNDVFTTSTDATSNSNSIGFAVALNILDISDDTRAWVGTNAHVTASAANETAAWSATLPSGAYASTLSYVAPITINAYNLAQTLDVSGNYQITGNGSGGSQNSKSVGGSIDNIYYANTTLAGVYAGAHLSESGSGNTQDVAVNALSDDQALLISPSSGFGSSIGVNGTFTFDEVENQTDATISNEAQVTAAHVSLAATEDIAVWNVSGVFDTANNVGVGFAVGANYLSTDTEAFIGDNSAVFGYTLPSPAPSGFVHAASLKVNALSEGQGNALAIVGSQTSSDDPNSSSNPSSNESSTFSQIKSKISNWTSSAKTSVVNKFASTGLGQLLGVSTITPSGEGTATPAQPPFGVDVSGSASINITTLTTKSFVSGGTVDGLTPGSSAIAVIIEALNETALVSASGDAAFVSANAPTTQYSAGVAGAVTFGIIDNTTQAYVNSSTLSDADQVAVRALSGGFETAVALGLALNTSDAAKPNASDGAGSFIGNVVTNTTDANITNSTVTGKSGDGSRSLEVTAYDQTLIGAGGGSFYGGGTNGVGIAITLGTVSDSISAEIDGGSATQYDTATVQALDASQIISGAAMGGGSGASSTGFAGGLVFNLITDTDSADIDSYTPPLGSAHQATVTTTGNITVQAKGTGPVTAYSNELTNNAGTPIGSNVNLAAIKFGDNTTPISFGNGNLIIGFSGLLTVNTGGSNAGVGFVVNTITDHYTATIADGLVTSTTGAIDVTAQDNGTIIGGALGIGVATGDFAGIGSVTSNVISDTTSATIGSSSASGTLATVNASSISVSGQNNATIYSVAGNFAFGSQESDGLALAYAQTNDTANSTIAAASVTASGLVSDQATNNSTIYEVAIDGAGSSNVAIGGSAAVSVITDTANANLGSANGTTTVNAGSLNVTGTDGSGSGDGIYSLSGNITYGSSEAWGAAVGINSVDNTTSAEIDNSGLDVSGAANVGATFGATIRSLAAAGGASGGMAVGASNTSNNIGDTLTAAIVSSSESATGGTTNVTATDNATIDSLGGAVSLATNTAVGVATAINVIGDTTHAYLQGEGPSNATWQTQDLVIDAASTSTINTVAVGAAGTANQVAGAGSLAVNVLTDSVTSDITGGASVTAGDNVGVLASNVDIIQTIAGVLAISSLSPSFGGAGVGVGLTVNYLHGTTDADISGASTVVNAQVGDATDQLTIPNGTIANPPDVSGVTLSGYVAPNLAEGSKTVTGVAVNAESLRTITDGDTGLTVTGVQVGGVALNLNAGVNVLGGTTTAHVSGATVDSAGGAGTAQTVDVLSSSHDFAANFVISVTGSGNVLGTAASAAAAANIFSATTDASIDTAATVNAKGAVNVAADSTQDGSGLAIGLEATAASNGGTGTGLVNVFDADTEAWVIGGHVTSDSLAVDANSENSLELAGGSTALTTAGNVGGLTLLIAVDEDTTKAYIGDSSTTNPATTTLTVTGTIGVTSTTTLTLGDTAIAAAASAATGVAGMFAVDVVTADTEADIYNTNLNHGTNDTQASSATVSASSTLTANSYTGALGGGTVGIGGSVNLLDIMGKTRAGIFTSNINAASVGVTAANTDNLSLVTATAGLSTTGGLSAAVGILMVDSGAGNTNLTAAENQAANSVTAGSAFTSSSLIAADSGNGLNSGDQSTINTATNQTTVLNELYSGSGNGTSATVSGGTITANSLSVSATDTSKSKNIAGAGGVGATVGASAAIAVTSLNAPVAAGIVSGTTLNVGSTISVMAGAQDGSSGHAAEVDAYAGGLGAGAFGAAVALALGNDTVTAFLDGTVHDNPAATAGASDSSSLTTDGIGAAGGGLAVGLVVSEADKTATVSASATPAAQDSVNTLLVTAAEGGTVDASGISAAAAVGGAGAGIGSTATDTSTVNAFVGSSAQIADPGSVSLIALANPDTSATATGVSGGLAVGLGASVAVATANPTVNAYVGNNAQITGAGTLSISAEAGPSGTDQSANTMAVAGAGGLAAANAAVATSSNNGQVQAYTGTGVKIPDGALSISANNLTDQVADATDVAAGFYAAGAAVSTAQAGQSTTMMTRAWLGNSTTGTSARTGSITITADGEDTNQASATAGSGGLAAGDAALAYTYDTSNVTAGIGNSVDVLVNAVAVPLPAATIEISAAHTANYGTNADSTNAAVVGGSGAQGTTTVNSTVAASIGNSDLLDALGPTDPGVPSLVVAAQNNYTEELPSGATYSAVGAAGGIANGAAALSTITLFGDTSVTTGTSDHLISGTDPVSNPGGIDLSASTILNGADSVNETTGGAFEGSGTNDSVTTSDSSHTNGLTNEVTIGASSTLSSEGDIGAGTYTLAQEGTNAYSSSYGAVGVADAIATTTITTTQNVTVDAGTTISAFGNINLTAGEDSTGGFTSGFNLTTDAQGYVRGLIAIPAATANTNLTSNASLTISTGDDIYSAQDVNLGAFEGGKSLNNDGTGHGFEVGFIPATNHGGSPSDNSSPTTVTINGTVVAGYYYDLSITIANCANSGVFCSNFIEAAATSTGGGIPLGSPSQYFVSNFDSQTYIANNAATSSDSSTSPASLAESNSASGTVGAFVFPTLFASGGEVTINAGQFSHTTTGSVTANGAPSITINNASPDYLVFGPITIPNIVGGQVLFTGPAGITQAHNAGITTSSPSSGEASITVTDTYDGNASALNNSGNVNQLGPNLIFAGPVENVGGSLNIANASGSYFQISEGSNDVLTLVVNTPAGVYIVAPQDNSTTAFLGGSPMAEWQNSSVMIFPGGNPASVQPNADAAISWVATWEAYQIGSSTGLGAPTANNINQSYLIGNNNYESVDSTGKVTPVANDAAGNNSVVFLSTGNSACLPANSGNCSFTAGSVAPNSTDCCNKYFLPGITMQALTASGAYSSISQVGSNGSAIHARTVLVQASQIDVDGTLSVGSNWSVSLPSSLATSVTLIPAVTIPICVITCYNFTIPGFVIGGEVAIDQYNYSHYSSGPVFTLANTSTLASGDALIQANYNAQSNQITIDNVNASQAGSSVVLDGLIYSTNTLGNIDVNGGLGHVSVNNQTGVPLVIQNISTGNVVNTSGTQATQSLNSIVEIEDLYQPEATNTTWYIFTPGGATIEKYVTSDGASYVGHTGTQISGDTTTYSPLAGVRFNWDEVATLSRTVDINQSSNPTSDWTFNGNAANPWLYIPASEISLYTATQLASKAVAGTLTTTTVGANAGYLTTGNSDSLPAFQQSIVAGYGGGGGGTVNYHGCGGSDGSQCNFGFIQTSTNCGDGRACAQWGYYYPGNAALVMTMSVKADNPIGISFAGNTSGLVNITSNAPVILSGQINNPTGATNITSTGPNGSITETATTATAAQQALLTKTLSLTTTGGIGSSTAPFGATLTGTRVVNATSGPSGIFLNLASDGGILLNQIQAGNSTSGYGPVSITANQSLNPQTPGTSYVQGDTITLTSTAGGIGNVNALTIEPMDSGAAGSGVVNIEALQDISIIANGTNLVTSSPSDLLVGTAPGIISTSGNVTIDAPHGAVLDAESETQGESLNSTQLQTIWTNLHLIGSGAQQNATALFQKQTDSQYHQYWLLIGNGSYNSGTHTFSLNSGSLANFSSLAAANLNVDPTTITNAQIQSYANSLYQSLTSSFADTFGSNWQTLSQFTTYQQSFQYTATTQQSNALGGQATWTQAQLEDAVNEAALQSGTPVGTGTPNIAGRNISITSGGSIGTLLPPLQINVTDLVAGTLTDAQAAALAVATTPGLITEHNVTYTTEYVQPNGSFSTTSCTGCPSVQVATGGSLVVQQQAPLFVAALGTFSGASNGTIYLQSTESDTLQNNTAALALGQVSALGDVNITSPGPLTGTTASGTPNILTPGNITLAVGTGDIGTSTAPVQLSIGGKVLSATAQHGSIYVDEVPSTGYVVTSQQFCFLGVCISIPTGVTPVSQDQDLTITQVVANGAASLTSASGSVLADSSPPTGFTGPNISSGTAAISAHNNITGLVIDATTSATLIATNGNITGENISAPTITFTAGGNIGSISGAAPVIVDQAAGDTTPPTGDQLQATGAAIDGTAGGLIYLYSPHDSMVVGTITSGSTCSTTGCGNLQLTTALSFDLLAYSLTAHHGNLNAAAGGSIGVANFDAPDGSATFTAIEQTTSNVTFGTATDGGGFSGGPVLVNTSNLYEVTADTPVTSGTTITVTAKSVLMDSGSSMGANGAISLTTTGGGMTLGKVESDLAPGNGAAITLNSYGAILGNGDGQTNLILGGAGPACGSPPCAIPQIPISLTATGAIGSSTLPLTFSAPAPASPAPANQLFIDASSTNSGIWLSGSAGAGTLIDKAKAAGAIGITTTAGDLIVGQITSAQSGPTVAITLNSAGAVDGNGGSDVSPNLVMTGTNALSSINAANGIGTSLQPIYVDPGSVSAIATAGDIWLHVLDGTTASLVWAKAGTVNLSGDNTLAFGTVHAYQDANISATGSLTGTTVTTDHGNVGVTATNGDETLGTINAAGTVTLGAGGGISLTQSSGGATSLTAAKAITFGTITSSSTLSVDSTGGDITGTSATTTGNASITGVGVDVGTLGTTATPIGGMTSVTATGPTSLTDSLAGNIEIGTSLVGVGNVTLLASNSITSSAALIQSTAGLISLTATAGGIAVGTLNADTTLTSKAAGNTSFTSATSVGDMSLTSTGGDVTGTTVDSTGSVTISGVGVQITTIGSTSTPISGTTSVTATGPTSLSDSLAGNIEIGSSLVGAGNVSLIASNSILSSLALVKSTAGSISLTATAGGIAVQTLNADTTLTSMAAGNTSFTSATSGGDMSLTSTGGVVTGTTVDSTGNVTISGVGVQITTIGSTSTPIGGTTSVTATGPTSLSDSLAGNIEIGSSLVGAGNVSLTASNSILSSLALVKSTAGSISLTATAGDIAIETINADTTLTSNAGGKTTVASATSGGDMSLTSGGTISFTSLTSGGNLTAKSTGGDVTGTTVSAVDNVSIAGVGVQITTIGTTTTPIGGTTSVTATGPTSLSDPIAGNIEIGSSLVGAGNVSLTASNSILSSLALVKSTAGSISLTATTGDITIETINADTTLTSNAGGKTTVTSATSGSDMSFTSGGTISFVTLTSGSNLTALSTGGDVTGTTVNAVGNVSITGVGVGINTIGTAAIPIGGTTAVVATGPASLSDSLAGNIEIGTSVIGSGNQSLTASGSILSSAAEMQSINGSIMLNAKGGDIAFKNVNAHTTLTSMAAGKTTVVSAISGGDMSLTSGGTISFTTIIAGGNLTALSTGGDVIGTSVNAVNVSITGVGVQIATVGTGPRPIGGTTSVTATGPTSLSDPIAGNIQIGTSLVGVGNEILTASGSITSPLIQSTGGSITLNAKAGDVAVKTLTAHTTLTSTAGGKTTVTTATSGSDMSLTSGGAISFTTLTSGGNLTALSSGGDITGTTVNAVGNASLTGVGVQIATVGTTTTPIGGTTSIVATGPASLSDSLAGNIQIGTSVIGVGSETLTASGSITSPIVQSTTSSITLNAKTGNITIPTLTAHTTLTSTAGGKTTVTTATSGSDMSFTSGGQISFTTLTSGGNLTAQSTAGDVIGTTVAAVGNAAISGVGVEITTLGTQNIPIGGTIAVTAIGPASGGDPVAGQIQLINPVYGAGNETYTASGSITAPAITSTNGSIAINTGTLNPGTVNPGQDIIIPILSARTTITATSGGVTTLTTATSGGNMSFTSGGLITFTTLTSGGNLAAVSDAADVLGTTASASGNSTVTAVGIGIQTLNTAGSTVLTANGPVSLADPYAGNIIIEAINKSGTGSIGSNVTANSSGSIFVPTISAKTGYISLTAGQDIEVPALSAQTTITTTANGVTNIVTATTTNGAISLTGGQTITFRELTAGGSTGDVNITSAAFVLGVPSLSSSNYATLSSTTAVDGSITAGRNVSIQGAGIGLLDVTATGTVSMTAKGFATSPSYQGPQLIGVEPDLIDAATDFWAVEASPGSLALFNAAMGYLTHGQNSTLSSAPLNFAFLTETLTEVTADLLTLSPGAAPSAPNNGTWQQAVQAAYSQTVKGASSPPIPYPFTSFNPQSGQATTGWWTGGIDFDTINSKAITSPAVTLKAGSVINGNIVIVNSGRCLSTTPGTIDGSKTRITTLPTCH